MDGPQSHPKYPEAGRLLEHYLRLACPPGASLEAIADNVSIHLPGDVTIKHSTVSRWFRGSAKCPKPRHRALVALLRADLDPAIATSEAVLEALVYLYVLGDRRSRGLPPDRPPPPLAAAFLDKPEAPAPAAQVTQDLPARSASVTPRTALAAAGFAQAALPRPLGLLRPRSSSPADDPDRAQRDEWRHDAWREGVRVAWQDRDDRIPVTPDLVFRELTRHTGDPQRFTLVLGEPGAGKTTLLETWAAARLGASAGASPEVALIRLGRLTSGDVGTLRGADPEAAAVAVAGTTVIPTVGRLPPPDPAGRSILWLLDALDELDDDLVGSGLVEAFATLPGRIVVSCRTAVWQSFGNEITGFADPAHRYEILPLDRNWQIELLIRRSVLGDRPAWNRERAIGLVDRIRRNAQMRDISGNPQLLELIAEVEGAPGPKATLPSSRAAFFGDAIAVRWRKAPTGMRRRLPTALLSSDIRN